MSSKNAPFEAYAKHKFASQPISSRMGTALARDKSTRTWKGKSPRASLRFETNYCL